MEVDLQRFLDATLVALARETIVPYALLARRGAGKIQHQVAYSETLSAAPPEVKARITLNFHFDVFSLTIEVRSTHLLWKGVVEMYPGGGFSCRSHIKPEANQDVMAHLDSLRGMIRVLLQREAARGASHGTTTPDC